MKKKVIVSACLLGEYCRYDGATKKDTALMTWLKDKDIVPFCPEDPVFGTPRPRIKLVKLSGDFALFRENDNQNVTAAIIDQTKILLKSHPDAHFAVLKSKSPSCGCGTTPVFDEKNQEIQKGDGMAARLIKEASIDVYDETNYRGIEC